MTDTLRQPPHSAEAEQALLGSLLLDSDSLRLVEGPISGGMFFSDAHRVIFAELEQRIGQGKATDLVSVFDSLRDRGLADRAGGLPHLNALLQSVASSRNISRWAAIVREKAQLRAVIVAADNAASWAFSGDPAAAGKAAEVFAAIERAQVAKAPRSLASIAAARTTHYEALERREITPGWPTHIPTLDRRLNGGLRPGSLYILAARPGIGKSSLALWFAEQLAGQQLQTLVLSLEMPEAEVADRAVAQTGRIDYSALLSGQMGHEDWGRAAEALERLAQMPLYLDDQGGLSLADIKAKARAVRGLRVLVVDYLQLAAGNNPKDNRNTQLEEMTRGLKAFAKAEGLAILCLSQLNRKAEERANKRPTLSDLRDSGGIEQDADAVLMLWLVRHFEGEGRKIIGCSVEKNRQGSAGAFTLDFYGAQQRWGESTATLDEPPPRRGRGDDL